MQNEVYTDIDDLFELYALMTVDDKHGDIAAMRYCLAHCDPSIAQAFTQRIENINTNRNALAEYIAAGYWLVPCKEINGRQLLCGKLYIDKEHTKIDPAMQIKDIATLKAQQDRGIVNFGLYPIRNRLIVIDLDKGDAHANKSDGIADFTDLIATLKLTPAERAYFDDFPTNFPCYVESAHGGIHLYFKDDYIDPDTKKELITSHVEDKNIEVKYTTKITAAGSIRTDGNCYVLRGMLQNAPNMTNGLINALLKPATKRPARTDVLSSANTQKRQYPQKSNWAQSKNKAMWYSTPEGIVAKAREKAGSASPHDFMQKLGIYFSKSGYSVDIALQYAMQTTEHINRRDKNDTISCIKSFY